MPELFNIFPICHGRRVPKKAWTKLSYSSWQLQSLQGSIWEKIRIKHIKAETVQNHCSLLPKAMVHYWWDIWERHSHHFVIETVSTKICTSIAHMLFVWTRDHDTAFEKIKQIFSYDTMLSHPDWKTIFEIYADNILVGNFVNMLITQTKKHFFIMFITYLNTLELKE